MRERLKFTNLYQEMMIVMAIAEKENKKATKVDFNRENWSRRNENEKAL